MSWTAFPWNPALPSSVAIQTFLEYFIALSLRMRSLSERAAIMVSAPDSFTAGSMDAVPTPPPMIRYFFSGSISYPCP